LFRPSPKPLLSDVPVQDVLDGKANNPILKPGDEIRLTYDSKVVGDVSFQVTDPADRGGSGMLPSLPQRDMTLTQVLAIFHYDLNAIPNKKVTLLRAGTGGKVKILDGVGIGDLLSGKPIR